MSGIKVDITSLALRSNDVVRISNVDMDQNEKYGFEIEIDHQYKFIKWADETLGYLPYLAENTEGRIILVFNNSTDAMLFSIHYAHVWNYTDD